MWRNVLDHLARVDPIERLIPDPGSLHRCQGSKGHCNRVLRQLMTYVANATCLVFTRAGIYRDTQTQGRHFNFFLRGTNFLNVSMPPDYLKNWKNSTLYAVIWRYSIQFFFFFLFLFFSFFFFSFFFLFPWGRRLPAPSNDAPAQVRSIPVFYLVPLSWEGKWTWGGGGQIKDGSRNFFGRTKFYIRKLRAS